MKKFIFKATTLGVFTVAFSLFLIKDIKAEDRQEDGQDRQIERPMQMELLRQMIPCASDKAQGHQTDSEVETYDDSNPPSWLESLEASQGQKVIEAIQHLHVEQFIDPESGLIVEKLIDPNAEDSGLLMELVYNPETGVGQIIRICGGGGGWRGSIYRNAVEGAIAGGVGGAVGGAVVGGPVGALKGAALGAGAGAVGGAAQGAYKHWDTYHRGTPPPSANPGEILQDLINQGIIISPELVF